MKPFRPVRRKIFDKRLAPADDFFFQLKAGMDQFLCEPQEMMYIGTIIYAAAGWLFGDMAVMSDSI